MSADPRPARIRKRKLGDDLGTYAEAGRAGERHELLWAVLESLSEGVVACDASGSLSFFNRATRDFHGLPEQPLGPEHWSEYYSLHRADGGVMTPDEVPLARALRGEIVRDAVMVIAPAGFDPRTVICTGRPLHDSQGILLGAVVVMRDVTDQIAAARQKADLVRERELNRAKDEFLATVAHELRNPLTSILGWTQMLQLQLGDGESRQALEAIEEATRIQVHLIDDLSDLTRITEGKLTLHRKHVTVQELLWSAISGARPSAEAKQITLIVPDAIPAAVLDADRMRLQQVFANLLANALKFTPARGTITVRVDTRSDEVQVDVTDTGRGITPQFLPRVFERYAQETPGRREYQGLGLGLSIARTIVELHGGSITAYSAGEGTGATFSVVLPLAPPE